MLVVAVSFDGRSAVGLGVCWIQGIKARRHKKTGGKGSVGGRIPVAQVQAAARTRILRAFVGRGLIESFDAKEMLAYQHSGFSVDAGCALRLMTAPGLSAC